MCTDAGDHVAEQQDSSYKSCSYENLTRRDMRALVFHLLYAMESYEYEEPLANIVGMFNRGFDFDIPLEGQAVQFTQQVVDNRDTLDTLIKPYLHNWRFERIGQSTKLILRMAMWEIQQKETVFNIVINEAVELAKCFAEKDAYKFVNGILDEAVKALEASPSSAV
jgi:N utilization substance protein B